MTRTNDDVQADLVALRNEMDVAMAEASLASAKSRRSRGTDEEAEAELHVAFRRLGELDRQREALQQEARRLRAPL